MKKVWILLLTSIIFAASIPIPSAVGNHANGVDVSGRSAVLLEQESGRILFGKAEHEKRKIASITKIMTSLLAIESGKMEDTVEISASAAGVEGSSLYLKPGEHITLEDLTYGLMLRSGNDAATAIAEHVGGSIEGFAYMMNEKAEEIGMEQSHFTNPHGLDDGDSHVSTAYDMALLMQYAMKNETFREISKTERYRAPQEGEKWDRVWTNKNKLLTSKYEYCTGGKTGYTKAAGRTLVTTAKKNGMSLIAVTLDAPSDWNDHIAMFEWGFQTFDLKQLAKAKERVNTKKLEEGELYIPHTAYYPLAEEEEANVKRKIILQKDFQQSTEERIAAGKAEWSVNGTVIYTLPVIYENHTVKEKGFFQRLAGFFRLFIGGS